MSSSSDSSVDFSAVDSASDSFDAMKALYTEDVPISSYAHVYDNLQKFENFLKMAKQGKLKAHLEKINTRKQPRAVSSIPVPSSTPDGAGPRNATAEAGQTSSSADFSSMRTDPGASGGSSERKSDDILIPGRNFTVSQAPLPVTRREKKTVLSKMSTVTGPLARIKYFVDNRIKVKVVTRNYNQIRGVCLGYIVAFDIHWNLCLADVDETYQRRRLGKLVHSGGGKSAYLTGGHRTTTLGQPVFSLTTPSSQLSVAEVSVDTVCEQSEDLECDRPRHRFQLVKRHVNQLFVRGDNVVCVCCAETGLIPHRELQKDRSK